MERKAIRKKLMISYCYKRLRSDQLRTSTSHHIAHALSRSTNGLHVSQVQGQLYLSQKVKKLGNISKNPTHLYMNGSVRQIASHYRSPANRFEKSSMLTNPNTPQLRNRHGFAYEPRKNLARTAQS